MGADIGSCENCQKGPGALPNKYVIAVPVLQYQSLLFLFQHSIRQWCVYGYWCHKHHKHLSPRGKGIQCYNCQGFDHISHECSQPQWAWQQRPQKGQAVWPQNPVNDDERVNAIQGMSFAEMHDFFRNLKD